MSEATFTFRVDQTLKDEFTTTAKARDRTGAQLLRDFVRQQREDAEVAAWRAETRRKRADPAS